MKIQTWNVNGVRAAIRKGFLDYLHEDHPDMIFLQEIKAMPEQLEDDILKHEHYEAFWNPAERKGYSGTALLTRHKPKKVEFGTGIEKFDCEGRVVYAEFEDFGIFGIYFPNGGSGQERLAYKMEFSEHMIDVFDAKVKEIGNVFACGDFNVAHKEIDLARPKSNVKNSGFLPEERAWFDSLLDRGYVDLFRMFHEDPEMYTWWDQRFKARDRNVGWRIDYFVCNEDAAKMVKDVTIRNDVFGSDHCPVEMILK